MTSISDLRERAQRRWAQQSPTLKRVGTIALAIVGGGWIGQIEAVHKVVTEQISSHTVLSVRAVPPGSQWSGSVFSVGESTSGKVQLAKSQSCQVHDTACLLVVEAAPSPLLAWLVGASVFSAVFSVVLVVLAKNLLGSFSYLRGDKLAAEVRFKSDGSAAETWTYEGVTNENRRYAFRQEYGSTPANQPKITSLAVLCGQPGGVASLAPKFSPGMSSYRGHVHFAEHMNPPYRFTVSHTVEKAWATTAHEFDQWHADPPIPGGPIDYWDYELVHSWKQLRIAFFGLTALCQQKPFVILQRPGKNDEQLNGDSWKEHTQPEPHWVLTLSDLPAQTNVSVRWRLS